MLTPVVRKALRMVLTEAVGWHCFKIAHAPATCGDDIEVPSSAAKPFVGTDELMFNPGAYRLMKLASFEKEVILSALSVAPTLTDVEIQAG